MLKKIKSWWYNRQLDKELDRIEAEEAKDLSENFTREQMEKAYLLGYNDGRRDGLAIARQQATKSLKEILWQQNKKSQ